MIARQASPDRRATATTSRSRAGSGRRDAAPLAGNRNQRSAARPASVPHPSSTSTPNQSTDRLIARDSDSVSAPAGVSRAAHLTADPTMPDSTVNAPSPAKTNHKRLATASTISARKVPPSSRPSAANTAVPSAITAAPSARPSGCGRQPSAKPMAPKMIDCRNTTVTTAADLPAMMPHTGNAVAPSRLRHRSDGRTRPRSPGR